MKHISLIKTVSRLALLGTVGLLVACSSSDNDPVDASISGTIFAAAVSGADVTVTDGTNPDVAGPVSTNADGEYALVILHGSLNQGLYIKSTGGSFIDEATGNNGTAGEMLAYVAAIKNGDSISVTPGSTIIANLVMKHGKSLTQAQTLFDAAFGYTPDLSVVPVNATATPSAGASDESVLAGLRAAAFSQLALDLGLSQNDQFALFAALAADLSDDALNGVDASNVAVAVGSTTLKADIQNSFSQALVNFRAGGRNKTGLKPNQIGGVPFAKVVLTDSYKVEYIEGMMKAQIGKTMFKLRITNNNDSNPATGLMVGMMPMMNMENHSHSSAKGDCVEDGTTGVYNCTMYYVMGSVMGNGDSMGYWKLKVNIGGMSGESANFYPLVKHMAMGGTALVKLRGQEGDKIPGMGGMAMNRPYLLFRDGSLSGMNDNHTCNLYIATRETMMSYPAVFQGTTLNAGTAYELAVTAMTVEVSTDGGTSWTSATGSGNGKWEATGLTGLTNGTEATIYARLTINGEIKTTDGEAPAGANDYATFTITPGGM